MQSMLERKPRAQRAARVYNPSAIRRRERLVEVDASNIAHLLCYSLTREDKSIEHSIEVDLETGETRCSCEHFRFVCSKQKVTITNAMAKGCKHIHRAIGILRRHDLLPVEAKPVAEVTLQKVAAVEAKCPKCLSSKLGDLGGPYCFACGDWINL